MSSDFSANFCSPRFDQIFSLIIFDYCFVEINKKKLVSNFLSTFNVEQFPNPTTFSCIVQKRFSSIERKLRCL